MNLLRRSAESLLAVLTFIVALLPFALLVLAVMLRSGRPIFDLRRALGPKGKVVTFYRVRTEGLRGLVVLGTFVRWSRLDRFPQLWNVVRGEASLVGLRPSTSAARRPDNLDGRKALHLVGESVREMGILVFVFAPLDASFRVKNEQPSLVARYLVLIEVIALCVIAIGIIMESVTFAPTRSREEE